MEGRGKAVEKVWQGRGKTKERPWKRSGKAVERQRKGSGKGVPEILPPAAVPRVGPARRRRRRLIRHAGRWRSSIRHGPSRSDCAAPPRLSGAGRPAGPPRRPGCRDASPRVTPKSAGAPGCAWSKTQTWDMRQLVSGWQAQVVSRIGVPDHSAAAAFLAVFIARAGLKR